jgi:hypothetical protein
MVPQEGFEPPTPMMHCPAFQDDCVVAAPASDKKMSKRERTRLESRSRGAGENLERGRDTGGTLHGRLIPK